MKHISDNLLTLVLAFVLGFSSIQSVSASVSKCMTMGNAMTMQHQMINQASADVGSTMDSMDSMNSSDTADCCNQNDACNTKHCASVSFVAITSHNFNDVRYSCESTYSPSKLILSSFSSFSLYRPPKV